MANATSSRSSSAVEGTRKTRLRSARGDAVVEPPAARGDRSGRMELGDKMIGLANLDCERDVARNGGCRG